MDTVLLKFSEELDIAIDTINAKISAGILTKNQLEMAEKTKDKLNSLRDGALRGTLLRPSSNGVPANLQLGLTRFAQEWTNDKSILSQLELIENYYSSHV